MKRCMDMEIEGRNPKGRPKQTWRQVVREDLRLMGVEEECNFHCFRGLATRLFIQTIIDNKVWPFSCLFIKQQIATNIC